MLVEKRYKIKAVISLVFIIIIFISLSLTTISTQHCSNVNLQITTTSLPNPELNKDYSATISASGGKPSYIWQLKSGTNLPPGLSFSYPACTKGPATYYPQAFIKGKPTTAGTYKFTIELSDGSEKFAREFTLNVESDTTSSIKVIYPNGGESLKTGRTYEIKWRFSHEAQQNDIKTKISLRKTNNDVLIITDDAKTSTGENIYQWQVPSGRESDGYKILIELLEDPFKGIKDESDRTFSIVADDGTNNAPQITGVPAITSDVEPAQSVQFAWAANDADNDNLFWTIDWGDGKKDEHKCTSTPLPNKGKEFSKSHAWAKEGTYTIKATVDDCKGGKVSKEISVNVEKQRTCNDDGNCLQSEWGMVCSGVVSVGGCLLVPRCSNDCVCAVTSTGHACSSKNNCGNSQCDANEQQTCTQDCQQTTQEQRITLIIFGVIRESNSPLANVKVYENTKNQDFQIGITRSDGYIVFQQSWVDRINSVYSPDLKNCRLHSPNNNVNINVYCDVIVKPDADAYQVNVKYIKPDDALLTELKKSSKVSNYLYLTLDNIVQNFRHSCSEIKDECPSPNGKYCINIGNTGYKWYTEDDVRTGSIKCGQSLLHKRAIYGKNRCGFDSDACCVQTSSGYTWRFDWEITNANDRQKCGLPPIKIDDSCNPSVQCDGQAGSGNSITSIRCMLSPKYSGAKWQNVNAGANCPAGFACGDRLDYASKCQIPNPKYCGKDGKDGKIVDQPDCSASTAVCTDGQSKCEGNEYKVCSNRQYSTSWCGHNAPHYDVTTCGSTINWCIGISNPPSAQPFWQVYQEAPPCSQSKQCNRATYPQSYGFADAYCVVTGSIGTIAQYGWRFYNELTSKQKSDCGIS